MNEIEKQNYIYLQTFKLQKLSNIGYCASQLSHNISTDIQLTTADSNKYDLVSMLDSNRKVIDTTLQYLFDAIDECKELLQGSKKLK